MVRAGSSPILIGRAAELGRLMSLFEEAASGRSAATALVLGEAGIGKSRLVSEFAMRVRDSGGRALVGGSMEIDEANLPYVPVLEALRPVVDDALAGDPAAEEAIGRARPELARLFPDLGPSLALDASDPGLAQTRLFGQVLGVMGRLGRSCPTLLVIEDLQWADRSTRELVGFIGRTLQFARVVLAVTIRTDALHSRHPVTPLLAELGRIERVTSLRLERLTRDEHDAQVAAILGRQPSEDLLAQTYARSDGNPFYTEELLASNGSATLSTGLRETLLARVRGLSEPSRRLLRIISVGLSVTHPLLEAVADLRDDRLLEALREAVDRAILTPDPATARYRFRHPLTAEAIYEDLLPGERLRLHRAYAVVLDGMPELGDPSPPRAAAELANHWLRAGDERRALPALVQAAQAAQAAFAQAEAFGALDRALAIVELDPAALETIDLDLPAMTRMAAQAAQACGEFARAAELWERAVALAVDGDPVTCGLLHVRAGEAYWLVGNTEAFTRHRRAAVALVPAEPATAERSWVLSRLASALVMGADLDEALALAAEATDVARQVGAATEEGRALGVLGIAQLRNGMPEEAIETLSAALEISTHLGRLDDEAIDRSNLSEALHESGRLREAFDVVVEGVEAVQAAGMQHTYGETTNAIAIDRAFLLGDWDRCEALLEAGLARGPRGLPQAWLALVAAQLAAARGDAAVAQDALDTVDRLATTPRVTGWTGPHEQRAHAALWAGRPEDALAQALAGIAALEAGGHPDRSAEWRWLCIHGLRAIGDLRELPAVRLDTSRIGELEAVAEALGARFDRHVRVLTVNGPPSAHLAADRQQLLAEHARAMGCDDARLWEVAATQWSALEHRFDEAVARWRHGAAALAAGGAGADEARDPLQAAHRLASAMGAEPIVAAVRELARRGRIHLDGAGAPAATRASGLLSAREREVLRLVAAGRSNHEIAERLFITAKTASVHVTNIKAKLGVATRIEAATAGIGLGLVGPGDPE